MQSVKERMINNLRFTRAVLLTCSLLLSGVLAAAGFMFLTDQDRWGLAGFTEVFTISQLPLDVSEDTLRSTITEVAAATDVNVYKMSPSTRGDVRGIDYYLFLGDVATALGNVDEGTFPTFTKYFPAEIFPADALTRDRFMGAYAVQGTADQTQEFVEALSDDSILATAVSSPPGYLLWPFFLVTSPWGVAVVILWVGLVLTMFNQALVRFAIVGLRRASGESLARIVNAEIFAVLGPVLWCAALPPGILLVYSAIWAEWYQTQAILQIGALQAVIPLSAGFIALVLTRISVWRYSTGQIISGARPTRLLASLSIIAMVSTAMGVGLSSSAAFSQVFDEGDARIADTYRAQHPRLFQPALSYAITTDEADYLLDQLGQIYRKMEAKGQVYLTVSGSFDAYARDVSEPWMVRTLVVNSTFLESLRGITPLQVRAVSDSINSPGGVAVLMPSDQIQHYDQIRVSVEEWAEHQVSLNTETEEVEPTVTIIEDANLGVVPRLDYDDSNNSMYVVDPVLIVTDATSELLSNDFYAGIGAYTSLEDYQMLLQDHAVSHAVVTAQSIAELSALEHADRRGQLLITLTGTTVMLLALVLGTVIFAAVHHVRYRTAIFLLSSTGSGHWRTHGKATALTGLLALIAALLASITVELPLIPRITVVLGCALVVVLSTTFTLFVLDKGVNRSALELS